MKCDKLMQDALNLHIDPEARAALNSMRKPAISGYTPKSGVGIDINSKLETALAKIEAQNPSGNLLGTPYMNKESLYKKLLNEGVSQKEIAFGLEGMLEKTTMSDRDKKLLKILSTEERQKLGIGNKDSGKVLLAAAQDKAEAARPTIEKLGRNYDGYTYNMQGQHNPTYEVRGLKLPGSKKIGSPGHFPEEGLIGWSRSYIGTQPGIDGKVLRLDEFQSDWAQNPGLKKDLGELPIDHNDFKKIMIVDSIDRAIKNNLDTIVIPITRTSNNLVGTKDVTQNYLDLQKGILPKIRQELDRAGLKLDVKKNTHISNSEFDKDKLINTIVDNHFNQDVEINLDRAMSYINNTNSSDISLQRLLQLTPEESKEIVEDAWKEISSKTEEAWVLKVSDKSGKSLFKPIAKEANRGTYGEAQGPLLEELKAKLWNKAQSIEDLPENTKIFVGYLDDLEDDTRNKFFPTYDKEGLVTPKQVKAMLSDPYVNAIEEEKVLQDISSMIKEKVYLLDKDKIANNIDVILDNLLPGSGTKIDIEYGKDAQDDYKKIFDNFPEFYKDNVVPNGKKYRWDALSVTGALGLGEAYSKLKEES